MKSAEVPLVMVSLPLLKVTTGTELNIAIQVFKQKNENVFTPYVNEAATTEMAQPVCPQTSKL